MVYPGMIPSKSVPGGSAGGSHHHHSSNLGGGSNGGGNNGGGQPQSASTNTGGSGLMGSVGQGGSTAGLGSQVASKVERVRPRIFGFQVHEHARLLRWQEKIRDQ